MWYNSPVQNTNNKITVEQSKLRNIAVIAHVDHGKTTLIDAFLKHAHLFRENQEQMSQDRILDTDDLEREKGITITAKNVAIRYKDYKINIIDTPGHADFGGEVERTLNMADGFLLLVDAQEGPMPQTEFVLKRALELNLRPIVIINKIDKKLANAKKAYERVQDLFLKLATDSAQLEFTTFYAIGRQGKIYKNFPSDFAEDNGLDCLLDAIISEIPAPDNDAGGDLQIQINSLEYDVHQGRYLIGRIHRGIARLNDAVTIVSEGEDGQKLVKGRIKRILVREGLDFEDVDSASAGEIVAIVGIDSTAIGGTMCINTNVDPLPQIKISPPAIRVKFEPNTSPFAGREGDFVTPIQIQKRLLREKESNIGLKIERAEEGSFYVSGRGELQISILIENMRREGYEFQIRRPEIITQEIEGVLHEPIEELVIDTEEQFVGVVTETLAERSASLQSMEPNADKVRFVYKILTRNLFGLRSYLLTVTRGKMVFNHVFSEYIPMKNHPEVYRQGVLVASEAGTAMGYALNSIQQRGELFISPGTEIYEGMVIGINKYEQEMVVNATKARHKSGVRVKHDEITQTALKPPIKVTLEYALVFIAKDEILEITPQSIRIRKEFLKLKDRKIAKR